VTTPAPERPRPPLHSAAAATDVATPARTGATATRTRTATRTGATTTRTRATTRTVATAAGLAAALAVAGCSSDATDASGTAGTDGTAVPHGYVEGASEMQEPQLRLVTLAADGALTAFDPVTEESVDLAALDGAEQLATDGRYAFATSSDGVLRIVDGGAWTVPHGDHSHYYLAEPREVGEVDEADGGRDGGLAAVASSASVTAAWFPGSGTGVLLDGAALADGEVRETARLEGEPHDGVLVPLGELVVQSVAERGADVGSSVRVVTADGEPVDDATAACTDLRGAAQTRVGVVVGCADGALLVTEGAGGAGDAAEDGAGGQAAGSGASGVRTVGSGSGSGSGSDAHADAGADAAAVTIERIPYPEGVDAATVATSFDGRPGRPAVAAVAGDRGAWLLDARAREWTLLPSTSPLLRASAVGDTDGTVVGVDATGSVVVLSPDGADGAGPGEVARTEPLLAADVADGSLPDGVAVEIDVSRTYVNVPSAGTVLEIDHADAARVARTLDVPGDASLFVETGR